jgi:hypothetical protein
MPQAMHLHQHIPTAAEASAVGAFSHVITRSSPEFHTSFKHNDNQEIVFKHEVDRTMSHLLSEALDRLAALVEARLGHKLRVTATWDPSGHGHHPNSLHYEGRAADMTLDNHDGSKLGALGELAVEGGFGWVFYEDDLHIHASVPKSW